MFIFSILDFFVDAQFGFSPRNLGVLGVIGGEPFGSISPQSRRVRRGGAENFKSMDPRNSSFARLRKLTTCATGRVAFYLRFTASASIAAGRVKEYRFRNPDLTTSVLGFVYEIE